MTAEILKSACFVNVHFAVPGGGEHLQRVTTCDLYTEPGNVFAKIIAKAIKGCKRRKISVGNVLRITHKDTILFDYVEDTAARFT